MADAVRELLRAAQAAEIRGDKALAIELLRKAASQYRSSGNESRAMQMQRHADRLEAAAGGTEAAEETVPGRGVLGIVERRPTLADPALGAWCSFCCRPGTEAGDLAAGVSGTFICGRCAFESAGILGGRPRARMVSAGTTALALIELDSQREGLEALRGGLSIGARLILLLGPEGSGKSVQLAALAAQGRGRLLASDLSGFADRAGERYLVDGLEAAEPAEREKLWTALQSPGGPSAVFAVRAGPPRRSSKRKGGLPVISSRELAATTRGLLPAALAGRVDAVATFMRPTVADLTRMAKARAGASGVERVSEKILAALAREARRSGRDGHEVEALVSRWVAAVKGRASASDNG